MGLRGNLPVVLQFTDCLEEVYKQLSQKHTLLVESLLPDQMWLADEYRDQLCRLQKRFFGFGRECLPSADVPRATSPSKNELNVHTEHRIEEDPQLLEVPANPLGVLQNSAVETRLYFSDEN